MRWPWQEREERAALQRDLSLVEALGFERHYAQLVTATTTEFLSAASASIEAISSTVATLPAYVYRSTPSGREEDSNHPLARLIYYGPNNHQTWPDFVQWLVAETLRHGNAIVEVLRDDGGALIGLQPLPLDRRTIMLLPAGRLAYDFSDPITLQRRKRRCQATAVSCAVVE